MRLGYREMHNTCLHVNSNVSIVKYSSRVSVCGIQHFTGTLHVGNRLIIFLSSRRETHKLNYLFSMIITLLFCLKQIPGLPTDGVLFIPGQGVLCPHHASHGSRVSSSSELCGKFTEIKRLKGRYILGNTGKTAFSSMLTLLESRYTFQAENIALQIYLLLNKKNS